MDRKSALACFAALSQETRLSVVRLLVKAGDAGVAAGVIAHRLGVSPSNVSFHLKELERAGLVEQRREARSIIYVASLDTLRALIGFLLKDCCNSRPEICAPVMEIASASCCPPPKRRAHG